MPLHSCAEMKWLAGTMACVHKMKVTVECVIAAVDAGNKFLLVMRR